MPSHQFQGPQASKPVIKGSLTLIAKEANQTLFQSTEYFARALGAARATEKENHDDPDGGDHQESNWGFKPVSPLPMWLGSHKTPSTGTDETAG